ncbi:hypothetical protein BC835DRAFT_344207 [Cytidiella melzeri]|nr:hypothetical protein BC835DRAFT_344207 [Cytidiella melzeri]
MGYVNYGVGAGIPVLTKRFLCWVKGVLPIFYVSTILALAVTVKVTTHQISCRT